ncbi:MAG: DUF7706 family protein [Polaromonas sp.]
MEKVSVQLELDETQALALAQFVKRVTWSEMRACAVDDDEAYLIRAAVDQVARALADKGYDPR